MIRQALAIALLAGAAAQTGTQDQAYFAILVETKVSRMVGMKMPDMSNIKLPPGIKLPPQAERAMKMYSGKPTRILDIRLWSPTIAPANAEATVAPPAGLKQGDKLNLDLYRPEGSSSTGGDVKDFSPESNPDFTIKIYWGSSPTVKPDQPKIIKWTGLTPDESAAMKDRVRQAQQAQGSYFYKPGWTTGYWPTEKQPGEIDPDASLVGKYSLTTNYTGNVDIEAPSNVDFLAPIAMSSPDLDQKIDFNKAIQFQWAPIPNVLGQYAAIMGMEGKNTLIIWTSSEVYTDRMMADMGFLQMADVRDFVSQTVFMGPDRTDVTVPAGIFKDADFAMMNMVGYGPGTALEKTQPIPRIQTKTTLQLMLGGKKMNHMGG